MPIVTRRSLIAIEAAPNSPDKALIVRYSNYVVDDETEEIKEVGDSESFTLSRDIFNYFQQEKHIAAKEDGVKVLEEFLEIYKNLVLDPVEPTSEPVSSPE